MMSRQPYWWPKTMQPAEDMLVYHTNPLGIELSSYVNTFFCSSKFACAPAAKLNQKKVINRLRLFSFEYTPHI